MSTGQMVGQPNGAAIISQAQTAATLASVYRSSFQPPAAFAHGVTQARAACLRALILNRRRSAAGIDQWWPGGYTGWYLRDNYYMMAAFPGLFDATEIRRILDYWMTGYVPATKLLPFTVLEGTWGYRLLGSHPVLDMPAIFALVAMLAYERGDSTVWSTHGESILEAMDALPRGDNGLLYSDPLNFANGFGFHDRLELTGELSAVSAQTALAYQRIATLVDSTQQPKADALIAGLRTKRRSDGYYDASDNEALPDTIATILTCAYGLCSASETLVTANRLADDFRLGLISSRGHVRFLPAPNYWTKMFAPVLPEDQFQNGGYVGGPWVTWLARAMTAGGRNAEAGQLLQDLVDELLQQQRKALYGEAPYEWIFGSTGAGYPAYGAATAALDAVGELAQEDIVTEIPGSSSSVKILHVPHHAISSMEVRAAASTTAAVQLKAGSRLCGLNDPYGYADNTEQTIGTVALSSSTWGAAKRGMSPRYPWGGYLKLTLTSGSSTQPISVRLRQAPPSIRLIQPTLDAWVDDFSTDRLEDYVRPIPGNWNIASGKLNSARGANYDVCLAPVPTTDGWVEADIVTDSNVLVWPGLCARWKDSGNFIGVRINASGTVVFDLVNGAFTQIGIIASEIPTNGVPHYVKLDVVGTTVTVTSGATTDVFTTTITHAGLSGAMYAGNTEGIANAADWDDLTVTPVATVQDDWNGTGLGLYTQTGTWSVSSTRLVSTDAVSPVAAVHDDYSEIDTGVTATFKSDNWLARPAGLAVRVVSSSNCVYAVCDGPTVKVYDRNTTDTLLGTATLTSAATDGVDLTMTLRVKRYTVSLRVGSQTWHFQTNRPLVAGKAGAFATGATADEVSYASMLISTYSDNVSQPVPVGYVLDGGPLFQGWATDDVYAGNLSESLVLRDSYGNPVQTVANADDVRIYY